MARCGKKTTNYEFLGCHPPSAPIGEMARCGLFPGKLPQFCDFRRVMARWGTAVIRSPDMFELSLHEAGTTREFRGPFDRLIVTDLHVRVRDFPNAYGWPVRAAAPSAVRAPCRPLGVGMGDLFAQLQPCPRRRGHGIQHKCCCGSTWPLLALRARRVASKIR